MKGTKNTGEVFVVNYKYEFTPDEISAMEHTATMAIGEIKEAKEKAKMEAAKKKADTDKMVLEAEKLSSLCLIGWEMRSAPCVLVLNYDTKMREYYSKEGGDLKHTEPFRKEDDQGKLPIDYEAVQ